MVKTHFLAETVQEVSSSSILQDLSTIAMPDMFRYVSTGVGLVVFGVAAVTAFILIMRSTPGFDTTYTDSDTSPEKEPGTDSDQT